MTLNPADAAIALAVLLSALLGAWRGFLLEVMALLSWGLAFWAGFMFGQPLADALGGWIETAAVRSLLGHVGAFLLMLLSCAAVTWLLRRLLHRSGLSGSDRSLGLLFGLLRGLALTVLAVFGLGLTPLPQQSWWSQSLLLPPLEAAAAVVGSWLPDVLSGQLQFPVRSPSPDSTPALAPADP